MNDSVSVHRQLDRRLLERAPSLAELSPEQRERMAASAGIHTAAARETLFRQGEAATAFFFLTDGRVKLTQVSPEGQELVVRFIAPGQIFAAIALLPDRTYPVTAQAAVASRMLRWRDSGLRELTHAIPRLMQIAGEAMADHMEEVTGRLREVSTERVAQRLSRTLLRLAEQIGQTTDKGVLLDLPLSRQELAEMTGTTLYTVSRLLSRWEAEGLVSTGRERVVLCNLQQLTALTEEEP